MSFEQNCSYIGRVDTYLLQRFAILFHLRLRTRSNHHKLVVILYSLLKYYFESAITFLNNICITIKFYDNQKKLKITFYNDVIQKIYNMYL